MLIIRASSPYMFARPVACTVCQGTAQSSAAYAELQRVNARLDRVLSKCCKMQQRAASRQAAARSACKDAAQRTADGQRPELQAANDTGAPKKPTTLSSR